MTRVERQLKVKETAVKMTELNTLFTPKLTQDNQEVFAPFQNHADLLCTQKPPMESNYFLTGIK